MCELDMCHIKVTFGGHISLLTHSTANGQNKILAFGIHTRENKEEWGHFFNNFCNLHYPGIRHLVNDQDKQRAKVHRAARKDENAYSYAYHVSLYFTHCPK